MQQRATIVLCVLIFCAVYLCAQPFAIGSAEVTFTDPSRSNREIPTAIYYPATMAGNHAPYASGVFPVIAFGHGFLMQTSAYAHVWNALVPRGYIVVLPQTESGFSVSHSALARDMAFLIGEFQELGAEPQSPLYGLIAGTSCVMGHSMGGGASMLAVQYNTAITAVSNFAAAETNPSAIAACAEFGIPALVFAGEYDCITPPGQHQLPMYSALASSCKTYVSISGGSHCQFAGPSFACSFGDNCNPPPSLSPSEQQSIIHTILIPWLDWQLKSDCKAEEQLRAVLTASNGFTSQHDCAPCAISHTEEGNAAQGYRVYPVPSERGFIVETPPHIEAYHLRVLDQAGREVMSIRVPAGHNGTYRIDEAFPTGAYFIEITPAVASPVVLKALIR